MSIGLYMPPGQLLELYQLVRVYRSKFETDTKTDLTGFMSEIADKYQTITGEPIEKAGNPRKAGRKIVYDEDTADRIKKVYKSCGSIRQTARECGVSTTKVYKYINL